MTLHEKCRNISKSSFYECCTADQEEEAGLLSEAYRRLMRAYQEARRINDRKNF